MPAHHLIADEIRELKKEMQDFAEKLDTDMSQTLPNNLKTMLMNNFSISGVAPISREDLQNCIHELEERLIQRTTSSSSSSSSSSLPSASSSNEVFDTYYWKGRFHHVPQGFKIPDGSVKTLWNLYHFGDKTNRIAPYKNIIPKFDFEDPKERKKFSTLKVILEEVDDGIMNLPEKYKLQDVLALPGARQR